MWRPPSPRSLIRVHDCDRPIDSRHGLALAHGHGRADMIVNFPHVTGSPSPTVTDSRASTENDNTCGVKPRPRSRIRVHDCERNTDSWYRIAHRTRIPMATTLESQWRPSELSCDNIDLKQFPHHRHHVTYHAEWGSAAWNINAVWGPSGPWGPFKNLVFI